MNLRRSVGPANPRVDRGDVHPQIAVGADLAVMPVDPLAPAPACGNGIACVSAQLAVDSDTNPFKLNNKFGRRGYLREGRRYDGHLGGGRPNAFNQRLKTGSKEGRAHRVRRLMIEDEPLNHRRVAGVHSTRALFPFG